MLPCPICRARNLFLHTKNIITYLFILQMRKYFMQRIEQKWIGNWTSLFCGKLDFWRGRSDTAARCGIGFHNHHIMCQLWPLQVTYDRMTYGNTPYDQSLQPFFLEVGRIWKHRYHSERFGHLHSVCIGNPIDLKIVTRDHERDIH